MTNWSPLVFSRNLSTCIPCISLLLTWRVLGKPLAVRLKQFVTSRNWGEYLNKHKTEGHEAQHCGRNLRPTGRVTKVCCADFKSNIFRRKVSLHIVDYCGHCILVSTSPLCDMFAASCWTEMTEVQLTNMYILWYLLVVDNIKYVRHLQK
jgi:hypothetical protein